MKKKLPKLKSDAAAEAFVAKADLTAFDLSGMVPVRFEMKRKNKAANRQVRHPQQEQEQQQGQQPHSSQKKA